VVAVVGYDEALAVYRDDERYSAVNAASGPLGLPRFEIDPGDPGKDLAPQIAAYRESVPYGALLVTQDPPSHGRTRTLLMGMITPKRLQENEEFMWRLSDQQIDQFIGRGSFEAVSAYAHPYATLVIADLLGVPDEDRQKFVGLLGPAPGQLDGSSVFAGNNPLEQVGMAFFTYINDRREQPRKDVLTGLAQAKYPDGEIPSIIEVVTIAAFLWGAGQDTTVRLLTTALRFLAEDPELQRRLRADRKLIPEFIEECLRLEGPVKSDFRLARLPVKIGDVAVAPGTTVMTLLGAVNRDPRRFERPNDLVVGRKNVRDHLAFGRGIHSCIGAPLARAEAKVSLERLFDRTTDIRIDESKHGPAGARRYSYEATYLLRGLRELHLVFDRARWREEPTGQGRDR
jgi:cytochrome P450